MLSAVAVHDTVSAGNRMFRKRITEYVVLIAARDEESTIAATIASVLALQPPPSEVVVVVNNTTDRTAAVAVECGALVLEMQVNRDKKAGALNYGLDHLETVLRDDQAVLVMDADTTLESSFAQVALDELSRDVTAGAVSSVFVGRRTSSILGRLQQMEYFRYKREIRQHANQALVVSGTAAMIRWRALVSVRDARRSGDVLPQGDGFYDTVSLTEDNELTFALRTLGWRCPAPGVTSTTDVMESAVALYRQRHRWYIGALGNIQHYGRRMPWHLRWTYWRQQAGLLASLLFVGLIGVANGLAISVYGLEVRWSAFTALAIAVLALHLVERTATVWRLGWRYRLIALSYLPELVYSLLLLLIYSRALIDHVRGRSGTWHST